VEQKGRYHRYLNRVGWLYVTPATLLYILFMLYPVIYSLFMVTQKWRGFNRQFIGFGNFIRMVQDSIFWKAFSHNFLFMLIQVPIMIILALILATILNSEIKRFKGVFRTIYFLPCVTSLVAYSVIFRILLQSNGIFNNLLQDIHLINEPIGWLSNGFWAKITIMLALTWRWTGYNMVFFLVGLQNIDSEIYEAAEVDGAGKIKQFFSITLPLLVPVILFSLITSTNGTMQLFDEPNILTWGGGPSNETMTVALYIYNQAFVLNSDLGYAATLSYVMVFIAAVLAFIQLRLLGDKEK